ncbi:ABC transporter ATP-binding protein [Candidatus Accumulibacter sp. ACC007]|uniref:ABC transporter ATP-binding protein n=1 Tax=Candidatus Accumulibacter sp. ACC007 TaxID=2823333 RepID=UPI0025BDB7BD|nr:ABC transporter ATP-binding protein [Candidatus Accumulibacter sp. ACC007]
MSVAIAVDAIRKSYAGAWRRPAREALKGISLSIAAGETFGFIGPNGAGKSTLIKILVGALRPSAGSASIFGRDVREPEARRGLGFVPENPSLQDFLSPYEVLLMGLRLHGLRFSDERKHCMHWLERFDLAAVADNRLRGFSKGMLQRTALAHALAIQPRLLILDEPLSGLDPVGRKDVVDILDEYRGQGGTLFFSSHVLHDVERIADRFGLIHRGQLLTIRSPQELVADQADRYLLRYRGGTPIAHCVELRPGLYGGHARAAELPALIAEVLACGGVLQEVEASVSLETAFFRTIASTDEENS